MKVSHASDQCAHPLRQAGGDGGADGLRELFARGEGVGIDGIVEDDVRDAGMDAQAAFAQHGFRSVNGNRNAGRAGGLGEKERAFLEGQHAAVGRARAFNKCGDVRALGEHALRFGDAALRVGAAAGAVDSDELALAEAGAEDGQIHERALHEGRGAAGNERDERGRVEIGDVVGHEDAGAVARNAVEALGVNAHAGEPATGGEHEARGLVERQHVARDPAPGNEENGRRNAREDHVGEKKRDGIMRAYCRSTRRWRGDAARADAREVSRRCRRSRHWRGWRRRRRKQAAARGRRRSNRRRDEARRAFRRR